MPKIPAIPKTYLYIGGAVVAFLIINALTRKSGQSLAGATGEAITGGVIGSVADFVTGAAAGAVKQVSPANSNNVINQAFNQISGAILQPDNEDFSFGSWLYDATHKDIKLN